MEQNIILPSILTQAQAAEYLGVSEKKLERDRWCERRIPYVKMGRHVRYRASDLVAYVESNIVEAAAR
ncbi:helix-turn-helix domain-containing protein [Pseudosulfitobacter koreensis]|uniref:Helix-turn-helix domain-containing protein n=1 Tax=Pseudosulfitobacter koreensis TaxID=2968472 RepID=A0ABT1Z3C4_9RHOB|nr:helix-turn-helix domain-containing protein [Pseudosulfitobacter koreense]MCR8827618.1 helix-turn-helix domain-containing protein [Pseudosulfitobacter koreense]